MPASKTLRELSGKPAAPAPLSKSVLILVDAQNTYRSGVMELAGIEPALDECARLLGRARALKVPVIHIQHNGGVGSPYDITAEVGAIVDAVAPRDGEPVVVKQYPNSFVQTDLDDRLKAVRDVISEFLGMDEPRKRLAAELCGLGIRYELGENHPLLGRRMPDFDLITAKGPRTVFALLHVARPVLLW